MREKFIDILDKYQTAKSDAQILQEVRDLFREVVTEFEMSPVIQRFPNIIVKSGMGIGTIALVPWVSFLDQRETTTTQQGEYIVFLFKGDMSGLYLTFNQGVGKSNKGRSVARAPTSTDLERVHTKAIDIRLKVPELITLGFSMDDNIDLSVKWGAGKAYEQSTIAYKFYDRNNIPSDEKIFEEIGNVLSFYTKYVDNKLKDVNARERDLKEQKYNFFLTQDDFDSCIKDRYIPYIQPVETKFKKQLLPELVNILSEKFNDFIAKKSPYVAKRWSPRENNNQGAYRDHMWISFSHKDIEEPRGNLQLQFGINIDEVFTFGIWTSGGDSLKRVRVSVSENIQQNMNMFLSYLRNLPDEYKIIVDFNKEYQANNLTTEETVSFLQDYLTGKYIDIRYMITPTEVINLNTRVVPLIAEIFEELYPLYMLMIGKSISDETKEDNGEGSSEFEEEIVEPRARDYQTPKVQPRYSIEDFVNETGFTTEEIEHWKTILLRKKQVIFQGPPGTGKTFVAERLARLIISESYGFFETVQFHSAYNYEDFIQGLKPKPVGGALTFELEPGRFLEFCARISAGANSAPCVLIIDEINRANLARVFGELMYLLEYRDKAIPLASGGKPFQIPKNLYLIGTMNTADRSIALVDHALRRRFSFLRLRPKYDILERELAKYGFPADDLISVLREINQAIDDPNYEIGISFFMEDHERLMELLPSIWISEIEPYLEEYFYDQPERVQSFRWTTLISGRLASWVR